MKQLHVCDVCREWIFLSVFFFNFLFGQCAMHMFFMKVHAVIMGYNLVETLMYIACLCPKIGTQTCYIHQCIHKDLVSVHFYAIPILHFKIRKFLKIYSAW